MKCPKCHGSGEIKHDWLPHEKCHKCGGTGFIDMSNEEWLRSCPPQELIRFLMNVAYGGQIRNVQKRTFDEEAEKWGKWLKEKHE